MNRKRSLMVLFCFLTAVISLQSQIANHHIQQEQSSFGTESAPGEPLIKRPFPVPDAVMHTLKMDNDVKGCLSYNPLAPGQFLNSWFIASEIHLDGTMERDLVMEPGPRAHYECFHSAEGIGWFWVYRRIGEQRYRLVLKAAGNGLDILKARTNGYRNIQTGSIGMAGRYVTTVTFCFDGKLYRKCRERTLEEPEDGWPTK